MKPFDPRLLRYARSSRVFLILGGALGLASTLSMIGFAWLIALAITQAMAGSHLTALATGLWAIVGLVGVRAACSWGMEWAGARTAATAKSELRRELLAALDVLGTARLADRSTAELTTLAGHGLDALDAYFSKYVPQLILSAIATPLLILVTLLADPVSGVTEIIVLPVIPLFMALIGWATSAAQDRQFTALTGLAKAFLEIVEGLATLKIFGRADRQRDRVTTITNDYRRSTMKVLRVTFLSGFALELLASIAVALVAVQIGIRLIDRDMTLAVGLFALILAPEVMAPIRQVGAQFHAAAEGVTAANRVFEVIESAQRVADAAQPAAEASTTIAAAHEAGLHLQIEQAGYDDQLVLAHLDLTAHPGELLALVGESGAGKSTLLAILRGALPAQAQLTLDGIPLAGTALAAQVSWMGQTPGLIAGTVADNVALGSPDAPATLIRDALDRAGLPDLDLAHPLGVGGAGLSGGQAQRLAFARLLTRTRLRNTPVVLVDEPTSALDAEHERRLVNELRALAAEGRIVVVVSHRPDVVAAADRTLVLPSASGALL